MDIDRERTVTHPNGITQVFATALAERGAEAAVGAYQRWGDEYRTYAPDGSSLGVWDTEAEAYAAIVRNNECPDCGQQYPANPDCLTCSERHFG